MKEEHESQTFGVKLKELRQKKGCTQKTLAELLHVSHQTVSLWERDKGKPDYEMRKKLSEIYQIPLGELLEENKKQDIRVGPETEEEKAITPIWWDNESIKKILLACAVLVFALLATRLLFLGVVVSVIGLWVNRKWGIRSRILDVILLLCFGVGLWKIQIPIMHLIKNFERYTFHLRM